MSLRKNKLMLWIFVVLVFTILLSFNIFAYYVDLTGGTGNDACLPNSCISLETYGWSGNNRWIPASWLCNSVGYAAYLDMSELFWIRSGM